MGGDPWVDRHLLYQCTRYSLDNWSNFRQI